MTTRKIRSWYWKHEVAIRPFREIAEAIAIAALLSSPIWLEAIIDNFN